MEIRQQANLQPPQGGGQVPDRHRHPHEFHLSACGVVEPLAKAGDNNAPKAAFQEIPSVQIRYPVNNATPSDNRLRPPWAVILDTS
ncbi:hypothetical protein GHYDROH2_34880 [Geobacter hydrogenophilus]|uniref:Uncharacterized protein n=1 Tax=Geobacter hydrogenophilus TaxID=40983 RepID=A0A9W6LDK9_9BACT|nr:hypothetical protein GHYDROH2_34880 [Geobacter hydrogenophilus]